MSPDEVCAFLMNALKNGISPSVLRDEMEGAIRVYARITNPPEVLDVVFKDAKATIQ